MKNEIKEAAVVTNDTVTAENAIATFEVGKMYWASQGHRVIVVKRTAHYVTFNLLKEEIEAGQYYYDADVMTWLKASNVRARVDVIGGDETCYLKGNKYITNATKYSVIAIFADKPIEYVSDEESEVLTTDYNFEDEEDDDELVDPPEAIAVAENTVAEKEVVTIEINALRGFIADMKDVRKKLNRLNTLKYKLEDKMFPLEFKGTAEAANEYEKLYKRYEKVKEDIEYWTNILMSLDSSAEQSAEWLQKQGVQIIINGRFKGYINYEIIAPCENIEKANKTQEEIAAMIESEMDSTIEEVPVPFEVERFGEDELTQKFSAVADTLIEEFAAQVKGIIAGIKGEEIKFDAQLFNDANAAVKEVPASAKFEVGKIYYGKISPSRVYVGVKVVKRTAKFVTVVDYSEDYEYIDYDEAERHRILIDNKGELIEFNDDFGVPYYVRANHSEPPKKYKDKYGQKGYYFEDDACIPKEVTAAEDTAVEEVPVVDEETKLRGEYAELSSEIDTLEDKLTELKGRRLEVGTKLSDVVRSKIEKILQKAKEAIKKAAKVGASIELRVANREGYYWIECGEDWEMLYCSVGYDGGITIEIDCNEIVSYADKWKGAAAIEGFVAAIERGDEIYTFPADDAKKAQKK